MRHVEKQSSVVTSPSASTSADKAVVTTSDNGKKKEHI